MILIGDPQTAVSRLGDVVLFVQYALVRFKVGESLIPDFSEILKPCLS
jgi:hypothetical protein